jgi:hypothetical protein
LQVFLLRQIANLYIIGTYSIFVKKVMLINESWNNTFYPPLTGGRIATTSALLMGVISSTTSQLMATTNWISEDRTGYKSRIFFLRLPTVIWFFPNFNVILSLPINSLQEANSFTSTNTG